MTHKLDILSKTAVVTGAGRRLGLFVVDHLLAAGWQVHVLTRQCSDELASLACKRLWVHELGIYRAENVERAINQIVATQEGKPIHLLVNNASIFENDMRVVEQGLAVFEAMTFVHMTMPSILMRGLAKLLENTTHPGNVISITDIYADNPNPDFSLYCSTKAGLQNLTQSFAKQYAPKIRANAIAPGPIQFLPEHNKAHQTQVLKETLLPYEGGFLPIYQTIEFILNNLYLTGTVIKVDGGRSLLRG